MHFYNPLKPHIATNGYVWVVRKLRPLGWEYLDTLTGHWWFMQEYVEKHAYAYSETKAQEMLKRVKPLRHYKQ